MEILTYTPEAQQQAAQILREIERAKYRLTSTAQSLPESTEPSCGQVQRMVRQA